MEVIPAINETSFAEVWNKIKEAEKFSEWVHLDIVDGVFASHKTWNNPQDLEELTTSLKMEIHLMVEKPESQIESWLKIGSRRLIVHVEAMTEPAFILETAKRHRAEVILALNPATPIEALNPFLGTFNFFQILAVEPGIAGQKFEERALEKIKFLRSRLPTAKIEVDGGITPETAKLVKAAGVDIIASASYIFTYPGGPAAAYQELKSI